MYNTVALKKKKGRYICNFCTEKSFEELSVAEKHIEDHNIQLVQIPKDDLEGLLNYIYFGRIEDVNRNLVPVFKRYLKMYVEE